MMTSSNGNIFRVTGHLCGEFTGLRWIPHTKASYAELWFFLHLRLNKRLSKQPWGWWFETPAWSLWRHRNDQIIFPGQNNRHFADDIFNGIFLDEKYRIVIKISLKFIPKESIENNPALVDLSDNLSQTDIFLIGSPLKFQWNTKKKYNNYNSKINFKMSRMTAALLRSQW